MLFRFNLADRGRKATLTVDGQQIADITIPATAKGSDGNGFYNTEYPIPADLAKGKKKFVVRLTASASTLCPGIYYVRLMKDYDAHAYRFVPSEWTTGDGARVAAANVVGNDEQQTLTVKASGANNVCLMLKYNDCDYTIDKDQTFLVVRGTNLSTASGASYLWWLNGSNHGTQVAPATVQSVSLDGVQQQLVAWNMATSGLYENFAGERPNVCVGQTIFGLTSTTGLSTIYDINFVSNVDAYIEKTTGITPVGAMPASHSQSDCYTLGGTRIVGQPHGLYLTSGKKVLAEH